MTTIENIIGGVKRVGSSVGPLVLGGAGATLLGGVAGAVVARRHHNKKARKAASRKRASASRKARKPAKKHGRRASKRGSSNAREDRSGRVSTKKSYRGKHVYWTKNGQPYVKTASGKARFIKK